VWQLGLSPQPKVFFADELPLQQAQSVANAKHDCLVIQAVTGTATNNDVTILPHANSSEAESEKKIANACAAEAPSQIFLGPCFVVTKVTNNSSACAILTPERGPINGTADVGRSQSARESTKAVTPGLFFPEIDTNICCFACWLSSKSVTRKAI